MTRARAELGQAGEALAAAHLEDAGYRILARRWRGVGREIDLVAERDGVVAFVEVKTRGARALAPAAAAVDWRKRRQILSAARAGALHWGGVARAFRFDVVSVMWGPEGPVIEHIEDAFRLEP